MAQKLGEAAVGSVIKINESGIPQEYIITNQGTPNASLYINADGTWVRRKTAIKQMIYTVNGSHSDPRGNRYEGSDLDEYLTDSVSGFPAILDPTIKEHILTVKIPYTPNGPNYNTPVSSGNSGLERQFFVLSVYEQNADATEHGNNEGVPLQFYSDASNTDRVIEFNGKKIPHLTRTRTTDGGLGTAIYYITSDGEPNWGSAETNGGVVPSFVFDGSLFVLDDGTVTTNQPPTAPGSIDVANVGSSGTITITLTAATDPDGTVESYIYERQVDGGAWEQVAQANSLTQTDTIGEEWGTVAYRACAVDDKGVSGPCVTSETFTVNSGWTIISGPAESMGSKPAPFDFVFSVSVTGEPDADAIMVSAALDGEQVYSGTPSAGEQVTIPIKTHLLGAGIHTIEVQASKDDYLPASKRYTFTVPAVTIPDGGVGALAQGPDGRAVYHTTLAQRCIGTGGVDIQAQMDALTARVKTLEG